MENPCFSEGDNINPATEEAAPKKCCPFCGKQFNRQYDFTQHIRIHTGEKPFPCSFCNKTFRNKHHVKNHEAIHKGEKNYCCSICRKAFICGSSLRRHMRTHTGEKPYKCRYCGKEFPDSSYVLIHERSHTGERPYSCLTCGKSYIRLGQLKEHHYHCVSDGKKSSVITFKFKDEVKEVKGKEFAADEDDMSMRVNQLDNDEDEVEVAVECVKLPESSRATSQCCQICGNRYSSTSYMKRHVRTHTGEKPYSCEVCGKCFSEATARNRHNLKVHYKNNKSLEDTEACAASNIVCVGCNQTCSDSDQYKHHQCSGLLPTSRRPKMCATCLACQVSFSNLDQLGAHQCLDEQRTVAVGGKLCSSCHVESKDDLAAKMHICAGKPRTCPQCLKTFLTTQEILEHACLHIGHAVTYACQCGADYNSLLELELHQCLPKNNVAFPCDFCPAFFEDQSTLENHLSSLHNQPDGECGKQYHCACGLVFHDLDQLETHTCRSIEKAQLCKKCGRCFESFQQNAGHSCDDAKSVMCHICSKSYASLTALYTHICSSNYSCHTFKCGRCGMDCLNITELTSHDCGKHILSLHIASAISMNASHSEDRSSHISEENNLDTLSQSASISDSITPT